MKDIQFLESLLLKSIEKKDKADLNFEFSIPYIEVRRNGLITTDERLIMVEKPLKNQPIQPTKKIYVSPNEIIAHGIEATMRKYYNNKILQDNPDSYFIGIVIFNLNISYREIDFDAILAIADTEEPKPQEIREAKILTEKFLMACMIASEIAFLYQAFNPAEMDSLLSTETKNIIKQTAEKIDKNVFILPKEKIEIIKNLQNDGNDLIDNSDENFFF